MIPYSTQKLTLLDRIRVLRALGKPFLTQGPEVERFEKVVCEFVGASHGVAVNSATSALHLACMALQLGPGDFLWTSPISFVASANCGLYTGARLDFVDIDPDTWNISPSALRSKLIKSQVDGSLPKVLVVVHLAGEPADMDEIEKLSQEFGFLIIEDASHSLGSSYKGKPIGSSQASAVTVFSFHAVKNMTTGEGGIAVTQDEKIAGRMRLLRSHGIVRERSNFKNSALSAQFWYYEQQALGFNYRITDFQAALGISQLKSLWKRNEHRRRVLEQYSLGFNGNPNVKLQTLRADSLSAVHLAIIRVPAGKRDALMKELLSGGYSTNLHYFPIHLQPFHQALQPDIRLPEAESYGMEAISLPCHSKVTPRHVRGIVRIVNRITLSLQQ